MDVRVDITGYSQVKKNVISALPCAGDRVWAVSMVQQKGMSSTK